jgi:hypothetical protein
LVHKGEGWVWVSLVSIGECHPNREISTIVAPNQSEGSVMMTVLKPPHPPRATQQVRDTVMAAATVALAVVAIDHVPERLAMAKAGGATTINFEDESVVERLNDLTTQKDVICRIYDNEAVVPDARYPSMWRVRLPNGWLSSAVNLTRAKDAGLSIALQILERPETPAEAAVARSNEQAA